MKILFSVGEIEKDFNANTKIVLQTAEKLARYGHSCVIAGVCNAFPVNETTAAGVRICRLPAVFPVVNSSEKFERFVATAKDRNSARMQFVKKHPLASVFQYIRYTDFYRKNTEQPRYLKQMKQLTEEFLPDAVICVTKPVNSLETVMNGAINCPKYIWQLDPWGLHCLDNPEDSRGAVALETAAFGRAEHIFTTPVLQRQYLEKDEYRPYAEKISAVEFPNIRRPAVTDTAPATEFDSDYINLLFSGIIADEYRSPEYMLASLAPLFEAGEKIRIYFMGTNNSNSLDSYRTAYPDNIKTIDKVPVDTAFATMERADVLVNISNTVDNQVPSKIFDYFSMGKPVLNLQKIPNCPAQPYFDRYPLRFTISENKKTDLGRLKQFLYNAKNSRLEFDRVAQIYPDATVDAVASHIADTISANLP